MDFGSVFFESQSRNVEDAPLAVPTAGSQHGMKNIAEMLVAHGFAEVIRHREFEVRSNHYDALGAAECDAKAAKLKIWENYVEGQKISNGQALERNQKKELQVVATEVLGSGKFYVQLAADQELATIQQKLASLKLKKTRALGFNPKKGDLVLAQFSGDNSWNRALVREHQIYYLSFCLVLPPNFVFPGGLPSFGAGETFTPMNPMIIGQYNFGQSHGAMSQNNFSQSQDAINMQRQHAINMQGFSQSQSVIGMQQGQHAPSSISNREQGVSPTESQSEQNRSFQPLSAIPTSTGGGGSQNFSSGGDFGRGRNSYQRGGGRFGRGRGRRQSR